jgi:hypothetical protein
MEWFILALLFSFLMQKKPCHCSYISINKNTNKKQASSGLTFVDYVISFYTVVCFSVEECEAISGGVSASDRLVTNSKSPPVVVDDRPYDAYHRAGRYLWFGNQSPVLEIHV